MGNVYSTFFSDGESCGPTTAQINIRKHNSPYIPDEASSGPTTAHFVLTSARQPRSKQAHEWTVALFLFLFLFLLPWPFHTLSGFPLGASSSLFSLLAVCAVPLPFVNSHGGLDSSDGYRSYWRVQNFLTRERIAIQNSRSASACAAPVHACGFCRSDTQVSHCLRVSKVVVGQENSLAFGRAPQQLWDRSLLACHRTRKSQSH